MVKATYTNLFGRKAKIILHPDPGVRGLEGIVSDETLNTIVLKTEEGEKRILKSNIVLEVQVQDKKIIFTDKTLWGRPEERVKKILN